LPPFLNPLISQEIENCLHLGPMSCCWHATWLRRGVPVSGLSGGDLGGPAKRNKPRIGLGRWGRSAWCRSSNSGLEMKQARLQSTHRPFFIGWRVQGLGGAAAKKILALLESSRYNVDALATFGSIAAARPGWVEAMFVIAVNRIHPCVGWWSFGS
jgi:hypothetical protein